MRFGLFHRIFPFSLAVGLCASPSVMAIRWVEDSFEDFADGRLDAAGQNIFVSRDGRIRTIHRFDLNQDGFIDLLFNSTHDHRGIVPARLARWETDGDFITGELAVEGSLSVESADLNRDGFNDLVFCPNRSGIQHSRRFVTIIWGGSDGWPATRSNGLLPTNDAADVAIADLNGDQWPDIAVLNSTAWSPGQPEGNIVRVYWGGDHGFLLTRFTDRGVAGAIDMEAGDFDGDGSEDLAVLTSRPSVTFFWGGRTKDGSDVVEGSWELPEGSASCLAKGDFDRDGSLELAVGTNENAIWILPVDHAREITNPRKFEAFPANRITVSDLDRDGAPDLILTAMEITRAAGGEASLAHDKEAETVRILWGGETGFLTSESTGFQIPHASSTAVGDLDGDGLWDLAVAVYQGTESYDVHSMVFLGTGDRSFRVGDVSVPTHGATDVKAIFLQDGKPASLIFCNSQGGMANERVPLYLYWGGEGGFDPANRELAPFISGYESSAGDLDGDGYVDLLAMCSGHMGEMALGLPELGANILWGGPSGVGKDRDNTILREVNLFSSNIADLNRDGYLDIVLGAYDPAPGEESDLLVIYYGSRDGYTDKGRVAFPSPGRSAICTIADFNRDDWLDIAVTSYNQDTVRIFHGSPEGFDANRQANLHVPAPIAMDTADLNADGFLDLVVGSYSDRVAGHQDTGSLILWGGAEGFQEWNAQWLPGMTPIGLTIADWDDDGYLDIFSPHYHGELTRESLPSYLYWGREEGFGTRHRSILICDSPSDALAADFDRDGRLDLAVSCHTKDGNHATHSRVFYNDGARFADPEVTFLPTVGTHWMWTEDMGHIYDRRWRQRYESSVFEFENGFKKGRTQISADSPEGTDLIFEIRSAEDRNTLPSQDWREVKNSSITIPPVDRVLQYRITFLSDNGDRFPTVDRVEIELEP